MGCVNKLDAYTKADIALVKHLRKRGKREGLAVFTPEVHATIERFVATYSDKAFKAIDAQLNPIRPAKVTEATKDIKVTKVSSKWATGTTPHQFSDAIATWDSGLSSASTFQEHIKQCFPNISKNHLGKLMAHMHACNW
jgi:hypothetical protein